MKIQPGLSLRHLIFIFILSLSFNGCQKTIEEIKKNPPDLNSGQESDNYTVNKRFFTLPSDAGSSVQKIADNLKVQNKTNAFVVDFVTQYGYPVWHKAIIAKTKSKKNFSVINNNGTARENEQSNDEIVLIPLVIQDSNVTYSALLCRILGDSVTIRLLNAGDYLMYNNSSEPGLNGRQLSLLLMSLNKEVFGHNNFRILDSAAFGGLGKRVRSVKFSNDTDEAGRLIIYQINICVTISVPNNDGQVVGCPGGVPDCPQYHDELYCETFYSFEDDGTGEGNDSPIPPGTGGDGGSGNGGPGENPNPCDPIGGRLITNGKLQPPCDGGGGGGENPLPWLPEEPYVMTPHEIEVWDALDAEDARGRCER